MNQMLLDTLTDDQRAALQSVAAAQHRPVEVVVADAVASYLAVHAEGIDAKIVEAYEESLKQYSGLYQKLAQ